MPSCDLPAVYPRPPSIISSDMSQQASTAPASAANSAKIFSAALDAYKAQTKKDIAAHPLAAQLKSCKDASDVLDILRAQARAVDASQSADEKWTRWLDPTVNVLHAFSAFLGDAVGLVRSVLR